MANPFDQFDAAQPLAAPKNPFDQFDSQSAPPAPARAAAAPQTGGSASAPRSSLASVAEQVPTGFNEALADTAGAPVDAMTWLLNRIPGVDIKKPFMGSESIKGAMGYLGINPDATPAKTTAEKIARGAGAGVAAMMAPEAAVGAIERAGAEMPAVVRAMAGPSSTAAEAATSAAAGAAGGAAGEAAAEAAPEPYKPLARAASALAGGLAGAGTIVGAARTAAAGARAGREYVSPLTESGRETMAARKLNERASNPSQAINDIAENPADLVSGSKPTTFQVTGDMGLGALEREVAARHPEDFMQRRAEQNVARTGAVQGLQGTGSPADVAGFVKQQLADLDAQASGAVDQATAAAAAASEGIGGLRGPESYGEAVRAAAAPGQQVALETARSAVDAAGGAGTPEAYGSQMRGSLAEARAAAKAHERELWNAVDPQGTLALSVDPLRQTAANIEARVTDSAKPIAGEERAILDVVNEYGDVMPFRDVTDLRSRVSAAMREERRTAGETATYARLKQLRGAIEDAISGAVEQRAAAESQAVSRGEMAPEQTIGAMLQQWAQQRSAWYADRARQLREGDGGSAGAPAASSAPAVSSAYRAGGQGRGQFPGPESDQGLPESPLQPNFDAAAQERLRAATAATRERKQTFDEGPVGSILRTTGMQGRYRLGDAGVAAAVFKPGPGGFEAVQAFRQAVGNDAQANAALQDFAVASMRRAAERPDGSLDAGRYTAWRRQHQDALRAIPGLQDQLDQAARASEPLAVYRPLSGEVAAAHVPESFFHAGPGGFEDVQQLRRLIGDERADIILSDYAASRLRASAMRSDGTLDPARVVTWRRQHQDALRAFPELDAKFADASRASEAIGQAAANRKAALDAYQQGSLGRLVGVSDPADVTRVIGGIFGQKNAVEEFRRLAEATASDQAARAGLRKAVVDHIVNRFISNTEGAATGTGLLKSDAFQTFIRQNEAALGQVFTPEEIASLKAVAADLRRANRSVTAVKLPGGSNTAQDTATRNASLLRRIMRHSIETSVGAGAGFHFGGPIGSIVGILGSQAVSAMREAGLRKVDDLVKAAMLDPNIARALLMKAPSRPGAGAAAQLGRYMRRVVGASLFGQVANAGGDQQQDGSRTNPVKIEDPSQRDHAAEMTAQPSPEQAKAGNYQKRHIRWRGLDIAIETEAGSERTGVGADGRPWSTTMAHPYGYLKGTVGKDGDQMDVYIGPHPQLQTAFVFDQIDPRSGQFDEHKIVVGARDAAEARSIYDSGFSDGSGPQRRAAVTEMSVGELKHWLAQGDTKKPPAYDQYSQSRRPMPKNLTLRDLLDDPRKLAEIRQDMQAQS